MTTERIDHAAEARSIAERYEKTVGTVTGMLELAQVHATLALVEQQRIANLIAMADPRLKADEMPGPVHRMAWDALANGTNIAPDIAAALGIQDGA